jgi:deoxyribonuclease IV
MGSKLMGAHCPAVGGIGNAVRFGAKIGCTAVQVFTSSPQSWRAKPITPDMVSDFHQAKADSGIECVISHDSYLVNLCVADPDRRKQSIAGLTAEFLRCAEYGIPGAVSHIGAHLGQGEDIAIPMAAESLHEVLANSPDSVDVYAETTAGQGSSLNWHLEGMARFFDAAGSPARLKVCVDTCHIFAAGYDIRSREGYEAFWADFERLIGLDKLAAIHCNDSKKALGTRVDRHEAIGKGEIGPTAFELLVNDPRFDSIPILLETPDAETMHEVNLATLRSLQR